MDILAARKKAAERAKTKKEAEPSPEPPADQPVAGDEPLHPETEQQERDEKHDTAVSPSPPPVPEEPGDADQPSSEEAEEMPVDEIELLSFRLGDEEYAVTVEDVREVLKIYQMTAVPNTPDYILGVMSLRGIITPILDLGKRLGIQPGVRDEKSRIIVVRTENEHIGIIVDRVTGVARISADAVKPVPENIEKGAEFLRGIARKEDRLYILLDLAKAVGE